MRQRQRRSAPEPSGEFRRLTGRTAGVLYILGGIVVAAESLTIVGATVAATRMMLALGVATFVAGFVLLAVPWHRMPRRASLWIIGPTLLCIVAGNRLDPDPYQASLFLVLLSAWLGTAQPRGTVLALSPLLAATFWWPIASVPHAPGITRAVPYVTAVCILIGEFLAWMTTRLHATQQQLREHGERRFEALLAASADATIVLDAQTTMTYVSPSSTRVLQQPAGELTGRDLATFIRDHVHPDDAGALAGRLGQLIDSPDAETTVRFRVADAAGTWHDVEGAGRNLLGDGAVHGVLLTLREVTQRTELERALTRQATTDQLTGLPNRTALLDQAVRALEVAAAAGETAALLLIDLDRFREVNDTLGHRYGDILLQQVATRLRDVLRERDTVARLGGDEFAVLLPKIAMIDDAVAVCAKIRSVVEVPFLVEGLTIDVSASIGLAIYPEHASDADGLLRRADVAMYAAKAAHLDHVVYDPGLDHHSPRRLSLLGELRRAIADDELVVYYQPQAETRSRRLIGLEALVRWQHPEHGLLGPDEFIPLAETTGLIRPLTSYVLDTAVRACRDWLTAGHAMSVAVNLSARCLLDLHLPDDVARTLATCAVPADRLVLEITESAIMSDPARALEILNRLNGLGVRLSIDDFGTGYSSMAYLKNLPVHELKVDRSFVTHMRQQQGERVIVRSAVDLAHNLGLQVIAEGVEDEETWRELDRLGCDAVQGYHLGRPMSIGQFTTWLAGPVPSAPPHP